MRTDAIFAGTAISSSGSYIFRAGPSAEVTLVWNIIGPVAGVNPILVFTLQEIDPADETTVLANAVPVSSVNITGVTSSTLTLLTEHSPTVLVSWSVSGTLPSFGGAYVSVFQKDVSGTTVAQGVTGYLPTPQIADADVAPLLSDPSGQLVARSTVLSDEGSFRDDFPGASLLTNLTGTVTFTNGSTVVNGAGTSFTTELGTDNYIRLSTATETALALVDQVVSDTQVILASAYTGATGSGTGVKTYWLTTTPAAPASITVTNSICNLLANTTNGAQIAISRYGDYAPFSMTTTLSVSQRLANQTTLVGFVDNVASPGTRAVFTFTGTDNTKVTCESAFDGGTGSSQTTTITLPGGALTSSSNIYEITQYKDRVTFLVNGTQVAEHRTHLTAPYTDLIQAASITNAAALGSQTTLAIDAIFFANYDALNIDEPVSVEGSPTGQPVVVQFGTGGGTSALPKIIDVYYNVNDGAIVANVYKRVATYTVPSSYTAYLIKYVSYQNEAASSRVVAQTSLCTWNNNTSTFTAGSSYASPQWVPTVQANVTTAFAAGAGNVVLTVTYTNETGTAGRTGTITIPKGSVQNSRWDLVLQAGDLGARSIQNITTATVQVGVIEVLGLLQLALHQDQSTTAQTETIYSPGAITMPTGTVLGLEYAGGSVAKQRLLDLLLQLVSG